jgi:hypothetical protein
MNEIASLTCRPALDIVLAGRVAIARIEQNTVFLWLLRMSALALRQQLKRSTLRGDGSLSALSARNELLRGAMGRRH